MPMKQLDRTCTVYGVCIDPYSLDHGGSPRSGLGDKLSACILSHSLASIFLALEPKHSCSRASQLSSLLQQSLRQISNSPIIYRSHAYERLVPPGTFLSYICSLRTILYSLTTPLIPVPRLQQLSFSPSSL